MREIKGVKPGDRVTKLDQNGNIYGTNYEIIKISSRITLSDKTQWHAQTGRAWGSATSWSAAHIRPMQEGDRAHIKRFILLRRLRETKWHELDDETLRAVEAALNKPVI